MQVLLVPRPGSKGVSGPSVNNWSLVCPGISRFGRVYIPSWGSLNPGSLSVRNTLWWHKNINERLLLKPYYIFLFIMCIVAYIEKMHC